ncbi:MAG: aminopeptidase [Bacteroidales bacterium]|nr:aminopeptidase [Bacteroidales bacterium]
MKRIFIFSLCLIAGLALSVNSRATDLEAALASLPSVKKVETMDCGPFAGKYLLWFEQPVSHKDPSKGTFLQRVVVGNVSRDSATVMVAEGYNADYALRNGYREELSRLFNLNNVVVEHRYFKPSSPEIVDWTYLTAENEAADLHAVVTQLKSIFPAKWIATGISKGGQNSAIYRAFYPEDVDITVPYVGPFCRKVEDGRHEPFIASFAGTPSDRKAVRDFQKEFLSRRSTILPMFEKQCSDEGLKFRIPINEVYDMCALEFSFAFWQWGMPVSKIPGSSASDSTILNFMNLVSGADYWAEGSAHEPFFVMAAHELGYYGYDTKPFQGLLTIKSAKGYLRRCFLPESARNIKFDPALSRKMDKFLKTNECHILFIYGEFDPWSAVRAGDTHSADNYIFIDPAGSHRARIGTFPQRTQDEIKAILEGWLRE